jgi:hypothetical protein
MRSFPPRGRSSGSGYDLAKKSGEDDRTRLRAEAEARAKRTPPAVLRQSAPEILHELEVRNVDLELQDDE